MLAKLKNLFNSQDLTQGSIVKGILLFLFPITLSTLLQQFYTLTDAAIVGQALSNEAVAAVQSSGSINFIILNFAMGCASGLSVIMSREVGAKNKSNARRSFLTQLILGIIISIILGIGSVLLIGPLLRLVGIAPATGNVSMELEYDHAKTYLTYLFACSGIVLLYNMSLANLRAKGDSFAPFCFLAISVILNIGLDFLFIYGFKMEVKGSAIATVISQFIAMALSFGYGAYKYEELRINWKCKPKWQDFFNHLNNSIPLGLQYSILGFGIIAMSYGVLRFDFYENGDAVIGLPAQIGYGAACKIINFLMSPLAALGTAMLSFISQNYGAQNKERVKKGIIDSIYVCLVFSVILNAIGLPLLINGAYQYLFYSPDKISDSSIFYGNAYLWLSIPTLILIGLLFLFRNILQGIEKPIPIFVAGIIELVARVFICAILPWLIFGHINASSPQAAYFIIASGDWVAWLAAVITMGIPLILFLKKYLTEKK